MQTNVIATDGQCEIKISKKGKIFVLNKISSSSPSTEAESHNRQKNYILASAPGHERFLYLLGLASESGRILDKKQSKFRQINRFIEHLDDVYAKLPGTGELTVCDLCCGKSYLTFAVYYYLTAIKGRKIKMYGVDLKKDVIAYCTEVADRLSCTDLEFICSDISKFSCEKIDLVISLHACDIATDIVLGYAIKHRARVILSTPCCHHEMMNQINCAELSFITKHSMLSQKLCDAATDSLRCLMLEANGYSVEALELIDPDETPKNLLIRAILDPDIREEKLVSYRSQYELACRLLDVDPYLKKLMEEETV
jgi:SAM-dependent methyltransferase